MGAVTVNNVLRVPGRLAINPTDLTSAWPHGGTGLGAVMAAEVDLEVGATDLREEETNQVIEQLYREGSIRLSVVLREHAADVVDTIFPNTSTGEVSGKPNVQGHGSIKGGRLVSDQSVTLIFTPDDETNHPGLLIHRALPSIDLANRLTLSTDDEFGYLCLFTGIRNAVGRTWDIGALSDLEVYRRGIPTSDLQLWLDASLSGTITSDANGVSQWDDLSGNGNDATQSTNVNKPSISSAAVNSLDAMRFQLVSSDADYMTVGSAMFTAAPFTIFAVVVPEVDSRHCPIVWVGDSGETNEYWSVAFRGSQGGDPLSFLTNDDGSSEYGNTSTGFTVDQAHLLTAVAASATSRTIEIDSGNQGTSTTDLQPAGADDTWIGAFGTSGGFGNTFLEGMICEVLVYDAELSAANIALVETYLANKWGITLS